MISVISAETRIFSAFVELVWTTANWQKNSLYQLLLPADLRMATTLRELELFLCNFRTLLGGGINYSAIHYPSILKGIPSRQHVFLMRKGSRRGPYSRSASEGGGWTHIPQRRGSVALPWNLQITWGYPHPPRSSNLVWDRTSPLLYFEQDSTLTMSCCERIWWVRVVTSSHFGTL